MKTKKTKDFHIRLTEAEYTEIKRRAKKFQSIAHFLHSAIRDFGDSTVQERMDMRKRLSEYYVKAESHLAHIGGNLNQAMRQVNEAAKIANPTQSLIMTRLMPEIKECHKVCIELRKELNSITKSIVKQQL